jgi:hypothetical protein
MLKRKVTELKGLYYSLKWTNIALSTCPNSSVCWNTTDVCVISTADDLLVRMSTQLSAVDPTRVCLLSKISCFSRISWQSFPLQWYFKVICRFWLHQSHWWPNIPKFKRQIRWSCRPSEWAFASYPLFTENSVWVLSDMWREWGGAPSCMKHVRCRWWKYTSAKTFVIYLKIPGDTLHIFSVSQDNLS